MLDDMFPFIDPIMETGMDDIPHFVSMLEEYFNLAGPNAMGALPVKLPEKTGAEVPLDIALSLLRPDELEKLKKYVASYLMRHGGSQAS